MSSFCTPQLIATQCRYQLDLGNKMVALVIDSLDLSRGKLNLKAFRVNSRFVKLFDENKITFDEYLFYFLNLINFSLQERQLSSSDILEEVKINLCVNELESVLLRQLEHARNERVLRRAVDVRVALQNGGHREDRRRSHLRVALADRLQQVLRSVVHAGDDFRVALRVRRPEHNHLVQVVLLLETAHIGAHRVQMDLLVVARNHVIRAILLVGSDVIGIVDRGQGLEVLHVRVHDLLEVVVIHTSALHGVAQVHRANVPSTNHQIVGIDEREKILEGNVEIPSGNGTNLHCRALRDRPVVVRVHLALLRVPGNLVLVGKNSCSDSGSIVATPANEHHTDLRDAAIGLENVLLVARSHDDLTIFNLRFTRMVDVVGSYSVISVGDVGSVDKNRRIRILISRVHIS